MPVENGMGHSEETPEKQDQLSGLFEMHIRAAKSVIQRYNWVDPVYRYIDLNAGDGKYHGNKGSPLVFCEQAHFHQMAFRADLIEKEQMNCERLSKLVCLDKCTIHHGMHEDILPSLLGGSEKKPVGLIYHDPNGLPSFGMLARFSRQKESRMIDFLIYMSASSLKRVNGANGGGDDLIAQLNKISKKKWIIREPRTKHQWTFLLGTNSDNLDFTWGKRGFIDPRSERGREILENLTMTNRERQVIKESGQLSLFFYRLRMRMVTRRIATIVSI